MVVQCGYIMLYTSPILSINPAGGKGFYLPDSKLLQVWIQSWIKDSLLKYAWDGNNSIPTRAGVLSPSCQMAMKLQCTTTYHNPANPIIKVPSFLLLKKRPMPLVSCLALYLRIKGWWIQSLMSSCASWRAHSFLDKMQSGDSFLMFDISEDTSKVFDTSLSQLHTKKDTSIHIKVDEREMPQGQYQLNSFSMLLLRSIFLNKEYSRRTGVCTTQSRRKGAAEN